MFKHTLVTLLLIFCIGKVESQSSPVIAWIVNDAELWVYDGTDPRQIVAGVIQGAALSPDRRHIAYITPHGLAIVDTTNGTPVTQLPAENNRLFSQPVWASNEAVLFNTFVLSQGPPGRENLYDIQRLSLDGTVVEMLPPGEGGVLSISPDRQLLAITQPGVYGEASGSIQLVDPYSLEPVAAVFTFAAVASGSEFPWLPDITWHNDTIAVAIPPPDLLYLSDDPPPTQICHLSPVESHCTDIIMSYPLTVVWNADLSRIAFVRGSLTERQIFYGPPDNLQSLPPTQSWPQPIIWLDDNTLLYREALSDDFFVVKNGEVQPSPALIDIQALDEGRFAIARGDYGEVMVGLQTEPEFVLLMTYTDSFVYFAER